MSETVDELTCEHCDDEGLVTTKQLDKIVLTKGAWATIVYLYQDIDRKSGEYGKPKVRIQRYQKRSGVYRPHSKFNISSLKQAKQLTEVLTGWIESEE